MYHHYHSKFHKWHLLRTDVMFYQTCECQLIMNANFCICVGCRQRNYDLFKSSDNEEDLIRKYFKYGYNIFTKQYVYFWKKFHWIEINLRTLKRRLARYVLNKGSTDISDETLYSIIDREVKGPSSLKGYRNIWNKLRVTYGITVPWDGTMYLLRCIDPTNSAIRQTKTIAKVSPLTYKQNFDEEWTVLYIKMYAAYY